MMKRMTIDDLARITSNAFDAFRKEFREEMLAMEIRLTKIMQEEIQKVRQEIQDLRDDFSINYDRRISRLEDDMALVKVKLDLK
jgi:hypothetical protein